jgi:hypothetical protein
VDFPGHVELPDDGDHSEPPTIEQKCQLMRDHFDNICRFRNEHVAVWSSASA